MIVEHLTHHHARLSSPHYACNKEGDDNFAGDAVVAFLFCCSEEGDGKQQSYSCLLVFWFCCSEEGDDSDGNFVVITFFVVAKPKHKKATAAKLTSPSCFFFFWLQRRK